MVHFIPEVSGEEAQSKYLADEKFSALYRCLLSSIYIYLMVPMPTYLSFQTFANSCPNSKKISSFLAMHQNSKCLDSGVQK